MARGRDDSEVQRKGSLSIDFRADGKGKMIIQHAGKNLPLGVKTFQAYFSSFALL